MKSLLLTLSIASATAFAQLPKTNPPAGFGNTSLDRKNSGPTSLIPNRAPAALPVAPTAPLAQSGSPGLKLDAKWDTVGPFIQKGPENQRRELHALLDGFAEPGKDTSARPGVEIYKAVTYLMPLAKAQTALGLTGQIQGGGKPSLVGFPSGLSFTAFSKVPGRSFQVRLLLDRDSQVVAVEYLAKDERALPPAPEPLGPPDRTFAGKTYDFVPQGNAAVPRSFTQVSWNRKDYVIIATRGGPDVADLYIPKPMVSIVLYCLNLSPAK